MNKLIATLAFSLLSTAAFAEVTTVPITIKNHMFEPATVEIPANTKVKLLVKNTDATPEEFESHDFKREKVIGAGKEATINVGPLKPGEYKFFGEFNPKTAQGVLVVK